MLDEVCEDLNGARRAALHGFVMGAIALAAAVLWFALTIPQAGRKAPVEWGGYCANRPFAAPTGPFMVPQEQVFYPCQYSSRERSA